MPYYSTVVDNLIFSSRIHSTWELNPFLYGLLTGPERFKLLYMFSLTCVSELTVPDLSHDNADSWLAVPLAKGASFLVNEVATVTSVSAISSLVG